MSKAIGTVGMNHPSWLYFQAEERQGLGGTQGLIVTDYSMWTNFYSFSFFPSLSSLCISFPSGLFDGGGLQFG